MRTVLLNLAFSCVLLVVSCSQKSEPESLPRPKNVIRWEGVKLDEATYYIDGTNVGDGLAGFDAILKHISGLEKASTVTIESPPEWRTLGYDGKVDLWWEFPFASFPEKEQQFSAICAQKKIIKRFRSAGEVAGK